MRYMWFDSNLRDFIDVCLNTHDDTGKVSGLAQISSRYLQEVRVGGLVCV